MAVTAGIQHEGKLTIRHEGREKIIRLDDIYYMESQNHNVVLCLKSGMLKYYGRIGDLEEELRGQFYRIHRGYLINLIYVKGYDRTGVRMENGDKLLVSRYKYHDFVQAYQAFRSGKT